jgi:hypothetical protein
MREKTEETAWKQEGWGRERGQRVWGRNGPNNAYTYE